MAVFSMIIEKGNKRKRNEKVKKVKNDYERKIKCMIKIGCHLKFGCSILGGRSVPLVPPGSAPVHIYSQLFLPC